MIKIPTFLKWAGGKRRIIKKIEELLPPKIEGYFEPFLGGGAMFFYIKQKYNPKFCMISDINKDLINTFKAVKNNPKRLIKYLAYFKRKNSKEFYYGIRKKFNENKIRGIRRSAAFIYINKTCFNGLYRVNSKNKFNVPYGDYKNPEIFNKKNILWASKLLKDVVIKCQDYKEMKDVVKEYDVVYLDPCYDPLKLTSFANYTSKRFCESDRIELAKFIRYLKNKKANIFLSNNDISEIKDLYKDFKIIKIPVSRSINCIGSQRGKIQELLITNFI